MSPTRPALYRGCRPIVDAKYETDSDRSPAVAVADALAEADGVDAMDLPPLYDVIDPDALDALFAERGQSADAETVVSFRFGRWNVFVGSDGRIRICDPSQPTEPDEVFGNAA